MRREALYISQRETGPQGGAAFPLIIDRAYCIITSPSDTETQMLQVVIQVAKRLECGAVIKYNWEFTQFVFSDPLQSPPMVTIAMAGKLSSWVHSHRRIYRTWITQPFQRILWSNCKFQFGNIREDES